jgi:hypothetical protein
MSSARSKEVTESHIKEVVSTSQAEEDSDSDKVDPFFPIFAAEKKKHEVRQSRLPVFHQFVPPILTFSIPHGHPCPLHPFLPCLLILLYLSLLFPLILSHPFPLHRLILLLPPPSLPCLSFPLSLPLLHLRPPLLPL